ncbi:multiple epidermal growth factor-like domains protein 10 [Saccostrea echinata]|uniref:multiple epidermal growth factor-like domains protein 10 n=1 Tax=Saccostrea echinata TaxID=191078 RepID=UPI002A839391|nr:multiple epidermal growth factor-like domains protein 10 [Saccostrea echinata]
MYFIIFISFMTGELAYCHENIALGKTTWQEYPLLNEKNYFKSEYAVDGRKTDLSGQQCSVSQNKKYKATWRVDLGAIFGIHHIKIFYRTGGIPWDQRNGHIGRFLGFSVYISNTTEKSDGVLCFKDATFTKATMPAVVTLNCTHYGRYVIYYNERKPTNPSYYSEYAYGELCEFEVYGCSSSQYFGEKCSRCPSNCHDNRCHIASGHCFQCDDGYQGNECEQSCQNNTYGRQCSKVCGKCRDGQQCDYINGVCYMGCAAGYYGSTCHQECPLGRFGENCKNECSVNCGLPGTCDGVTGQCTGGCQKGWTGRTCDKSKQVERIVESSTPLSSSVVYVVVTVLCLSVLLNGIVIAWIFIDVICRQISSQTKSRNELSTKEDTIKTKPRKEESNDEYEELGQISHATNCNYDQV